MLLNFKYFLKKISKRKENWEFIKNNNTNSILEINNILDVFVIKNGLKIQLFCVNKNCSRCISKSKKNFKYNPN